MPWYVNFILAIMAYYLIPELFEQDTPPPPPVQKDHAVIDVSPALEPLVGVLSEIARHGLAVLFAVLFVIAGFASKYRSSQKKKLLDGQNSIKSIRALSSREFEFLVSEAFRRQGHFVIDNVPGPDGGVDLVLERGDQKTLVQCKNWRARSVGVVVVRELRGVMAAQSVNRGIVVCSGTFSGEAKSFAKQSGVELIDGSELAKLIGHMQLKQMMQTTSQQNTCPKCGGEMTTRTARKGKHVGQQFLGCKRYPKCGGTRELS